jgi:outer membrane protein TolC
VSNTEIARRQLQILLELEQAYYQLYALRADRALLDSSLQILESWEQLALAKVAAGSANNADVLEVRLRIREAEQMRNNLDRAIVTPLALINQLLSRNADTEVRTPEIL